ncbi:hypothetical protein TIFTF001_023126 [Ficus carica]|uniref:Uncharacterized protein n=1 Tax=Ficus carica TaxID=3494 RepID=A0AA88AUB4_FICCA|nr:hypothetical protein TIFTF001_023126 [Ficus carica]
MPVCTLLPARTQIFIDGFQSERELSAFHIASPATGAHVVSSDLHCQLWCPDLCHRLISPLPVVAHPSFAARRPSP